MSQVETTRVDAVDDHAIHRGNNDGDKKPKNRRPASAEASITLPLTTWLFISVHMLIRRLSLDTAFRQQRLKAWQ
jgi:hypothetical protein